MIIKRDPYPVNYVLNPYVTLVVSEDDRVFTSYEGGAWTGGPVIVEDYEHANRLQITPLAHRLAHELTHHLVAQARNLPDADRFGCRILWRAAHGHPQVQPEANTDEWYITAVTYLLFDANPPTPEHHGALVDLAKQCDLARFAKYARWAFDLSQVGSGLIVTLPYRGWE